MKMKNYKILMLATIVILVTVCTFPTATHSLEKPECKVVFEASVPDKDGMFIISLSIHNATFNTFQFGLKYNKNAIMPVSRLGKETSDFRKFASLSDDAVTLSSIGTNLDIASGLIEFAGYVSPGKSIVTDGLTKVSGYVATGVDGLDIYEFLFKKIGTGESAFSIASKSSGLPYSKSLPEGVGIFNNGEALSSTIELNLSSLMEPGSTVTPSKPNEAQIMTKKERLRQTIALQIGNYGATYDGALTYIDSENREVTPYIDKNNRTMVPVRFIVEQLGASVYWDEKEKEIKIVSGNNTIVMAVDSTSYKINNIIKHMDTAPVIKRGWDRTMVPIRFVTEALGKAVEWDAKNSLVFITELDVPWQLNREIEQEVTDSILFVISSQNRNIV